MDLAVRLALYFVPMILSLTVHEAAHALSAHWLGDETANEQGRMTLNPIPHIDVFGTLLLPALAIAGHGPIFGWAKPTPINAARFRRSISVRFGIAVSALAGPLSNVLLGLLSGLVLAVLNHSGAQLPWASPFLGAMMSINAALAVFNVLPVPPLDGSRLVLGLLPRDAALQYAHLSRFAPLFLLAFLAIPRFGQAIEVPIRALFGLFAGVGAL